MADEVNIPLLRKAVEWVEEQAQLPQIDRQWIQSDWVVRGVSRAHIMAGYAARDYWDKTRPGQSRMAPNSKDYVPEFKEIVAQFVDQIAPRCGTTYCVAGYIGYLTTDLGQMDGEYVQIGDNLIHVEQYAKDQLGLAPDEAMRLFAGGNDAQDIRRISERIAENAGEKL